MSDPDGRAPAFRLTRTDAKGNRAEVDITVDSRTVKAFRQLADAASTLPDRVDRQFAEGNLNAAEIAIKFWNRVLIVCAVPTASLVAQAGDHRGAWQLGPELEDVVHAMTLNQTPMTAVSSVTPILVFAGIMRMMQGFNRFSAQRELDRLNNK